MQRDKICYCRMEERHVAQITAIEKECFSEPWSERVFRDTLENENYTTIAAVDGECVIGYINISAVAGEANINNIAVTNEYRRLHIAERLAELAEEAVKGIVTAIHLEVRESNDAAIKLYEKLGFVRDGIRKNFYVRPDENAILMTKRVNDEDTGN